MKIVMDTNVLVSGVLSPYGTCGEILRLVVSQSPILCVDARILLEYEVVLQRPRFKIDPTRLLTLLASLEDFSEIYSPSPLQKTLPDPGDQAFIETAHAAGADVLITGNIKHFPKSLRHGVTVMTAREFMDAWRAGQFSR